MRLAVVDIGSNSTRLFLCERIAEAGPHGDRHTQITGLRRGAAPDGTVTAEAIERLEATLRDYARLIRAFGPARTLAIGTSAVRDAPNVETIAAAVEGALGASLTVVSGETEADLAYLGARLAAPEGPAAVIDIGGGSTEVVRGEGAVRWGGVSLQRGAVRCTEAHLASDPPISGELAALRSALRRDMAGARDTIGGPESMVIGVAGTFTTLAAVDLGGYDPVAVHGYRVSRGRLRQLTDRLAALPLRERLSVPGLHPGRAPYVVAGGEIAVAALDALEADGVEVSERDILDGIALAASGAATTSSL